MTKWTIPALLIATLASLVSTGGPAVSQDGVPAVPYMQVPELKAYIELDVPEHKPEDATVAKVDLNVPPDGIPEYIVSYHGTLNCGSGGCTTQVLRVKPSGKVENIAQTLGYGFGIAYTTSKGMLDLLTLRKDGKFTLKFDGRNYQPYQGQSKAATTKPKNWKAPKIFAASDPVATSAQWAAAKNAARAKGFLIWDPYQDFPEIKNYLEKQNDGFNLDGTTVAMVELSDPPDGKPEYLASLDTDGFCGSGGCTLEVLRKRPDGKIESLISILNFGHSLAYTYTNGMRDILSEARSGPYIWRFDGKQYKPHKGHPKAATTRPKGWKEPTVSDGIRPGKAEPEAPVTSSAKKDAYSDQFKWMPYQDVPEIRAYVEETGNGFDMDGTVVARMDFDAPPDGREEYILKLRIPDFCEGAACEQQVIRLKEDGTVETLFSTRGETFEVSERSSSGLREIITEYDDVRHHHRYDGKGYQDHERIARKYPNAGEKPRYRYQRFVWKPYKAYAEIVAYVEDQGDTASLAGTMVAKRDISWLSDGKPEYLISFEGPGFCKSEGCIREIIQIEKDSGFAVLLSATGTGIGLGKNNSNQYQDVVIETAKQLVLYRHNGQKYVPAGPYKSDSGDSHTAEEATASQFQARPKPYVGPAPRSPGCVGEYGWRRGYDRKVGYRYSYAVFGHCTDPENMLLSFNCRTDQSEVEVEIQIDPEKSGTIPVAIQVDSAGYLMNANTRYVEMFGHHVPIIRLSPRSPVLNALARGQLARVIVGKKSVKIHLKGAARAIATMRKTCRR